MNHQFLSFADELDQLDCTKVLITRFGVVQGINVLIAVTRSGILNVTISDGLYREEEYLRMLTKKMLPHLTENKDMVYVQESNEFTTSETVKNWFKDHPNVQCVNWPPYCGITPPLSLPWDNMRRYVKDNFPQSRRRLIVDFWDSFKETPYYFMNSLTATKGNIEMVKNEHTNFVRAHFQLDWNKTLFARFGDVRCINVFVAITQYGHFDILVSHGLMSEERYLQILNDRILPFMSQNKGTIYMQESNQITESDKVNSWFRMHPDIHFITWSPIITSLSQAWENMTKYVDDHFPLTGFEIKKLISNFFETLKKENPRYQINAFNRLKSCFSNIISASGQS